MTRRAYFLCSIRVIRRQKGASLRFHKLRLFGYVICVQKIEVYKDSTVQFERDIFFPTLWSMLSLKNLPLFDIIDIWSIPADAQIAKNVKNCEMEKLALLGFEFAKKCLGVYFNSK